MDPKFSSGSCVRLITFVVSLQFAAIVLLFPAGVQTIDIKDFMLSSKLRTPSYLSYWVQNQHKYLVSIRNLHDKLLRKGLEMDLLFPDDPWALLGTACQPQLWKNVTGDFLSKGEPLHEFNKRIGATAALGGSCLYPERLPVLECSSVTSTCICLNATHTPYYFTIVNSTEHPQLTKQCLGVDGSICEGDFTEESRIKKINCAPGTTCNTDIGICGGISPMMENAFAGEEVSFTPHELQEAARSAGGVDNFLIDLQMRDTIPIGTACNFTQWKLIADPYLKVVDSIELDAPFEEAVALVMAQKGLSNGSSQSTFETNWNGTNRNTQLCLDYFPSMVCTKARGSSATDTCICGRLKRMFNYTEVKGYCVAGLDSVCTTIHGPIMCLEAADKNIQCRDFVTEHQKVKHNEIASMLTAFELKVCTDQLPDDANITERRRLGNTGTFVVQGYFTKMLFLLICFKLWLFNIISIT